MEKNTEQRKKHVDDFIKAYLLHKKLEEVSGCDEEDDFTTTVSPVEMNSFDEELEEGQIRLLANTERLTYVALLKRWSVSSFVVMPFSRFNEPATDEEFKTELDGGRYLRVLQAWNTRTLQDDTLKKSWLVGNLPQSDLDDAWSLWEATLSDKPLSDSLLQRTGLPIYRKIDPRVQYKREELANFERIDAEDLVAATEKTLPTLYLWNHTAAAALAAAEEKENLQFTFRSVNPAAVVFIEYSQHDRKLSFDVYDTVGETSLVLDGCSIIDTADDSSLGVIRNGHLETAYDDSSLCAICFIGLDGQPIEGEISKE